MLKTVARISLTWGKSFGYSTYKVDHFYPSRVKSISTTSYEISELWFWWTGVNLLEIWHTNSIIFIHCGLKVFPPPLTKSLNYCTNRLSKYVNFYRSKLLPGFLWPELIMNSYHKISWWISYEISELWFWWTWYVNFIAQSCCQDYFGLNSYHITK